MSDTDIARLGVVGLAAGFRNGKLTPVDALNAYSARIGRFNGEINAFLELRMDEARKEAEISARRWKEGAPLSAIDGVAFGVKANIAVAGLPWHAGIGAYRQRVAGEDAACVQILKRAGAIPIGVLNMHEGALGATTDNPFFGRCRNPWDLERTPGGSSGGSAAAVAAGLCAFALGTDTMGSVRIPSAYCGIAGHKPTYGLVPSGGLIDLSSTLDHVGPHARSAADLQTVMGVLGDVTAAPAPADVRIGVASWKDAVEVEQGVREAFDAAVTTLSSLGRVTRIDLSGFAFGALRRRGLLVSEVEGHAAHAEMLAVDPGGFSDEFRGLLEWGAAQERKKTETAYADLREAGSRFVSLFSDIDVLALPTAPQGPFPFIAPVPANQADFTAIANFAGAPATATPASVAGAPPGSVQFVAARGGDAIALGVAAAFEAIRGPAPWPPGY